MKRQKSENLSEKEEDLTKKKKHDELSNPERKKIKDLPQDILSNPERKKIKDLPQDMDLTKIKKHDEISNPERKKREYIETKDTKDTKLISKKKRPRHYKNPLNFLEEYNLNIVFNKLNINDNKTSRNSQSDDVLNFYNEKYTSSNKYNTNTSRQSDKDRKTDSLLKKNYEKYKDDDIKVKRKLANILFQKDIPFNRDTNSIPKYESKIDDSIKEQILEKRTPEEQTYLASKLFDNFLDVNNSTLNNLINTSTEKTATKKNIKSYKDKIFEVYKPIISNFKLNEDVISTLSMFHKTTIINVFNRKTTVINFDIQKIVDNDEPYASIKSFQILLSFLDISSVKVLYLQLNEGNPNYILSPFNLFQFKNIIKNNKYEDDTKKLYKFIDISLARLIKKYNIIKNKITLDANDYDLIIVHPGFSHNQLDLVVQYSSYYHELFTYVKLINFNEDKDFKSVQLCSINSFNNITHIININKCDKYFILNTTWQRFVTFSVKIFKPFKKALYIIENTLYNQNILKQITNDEFTKIKDKELVYTTSMDHKYFSPEISNNIFNIQQFYIFSTINYPKIYKDVTGGNGIDNDNIPFGSPCRNIKHNINLKGTCWLDSTINSIFGNNEVIILFFNKTIRHINKIIKYIEDFIEINQKYKDFNLDYNKDSRVKINEAIRNYIILFIFLLTSYNILIRNIFNTANINKKKWFEIYNKINTEEFRIKLIIFISILAHYDINYSNYDNNLQKLYSTFLKCSVKNI